MAQTRDGAIIIAAKKSGLSVTEYKLKSEKEKKCCKCKEWKPKIKFNIDNSRWDKLSSKCHDCTRVKEKKVTKGRLSPMKGKKFTGIALKNIKKGHKKSALKRVGKKKKYTKEGYERLLIAVRKPRPNFRGENNPRWKGGTGLKKKKDYNSPEYRQWRKNVFERDKYICQDCYDGNGGNLEAHHIKEYAKYVELRYDVSNGITLCKTCHEKRHFKINSIRNLKKLKKGIKLKFN